MYSKNDYRYYLEHRMAEENYLAHYGVKGMKWKNHIKKKIDQNFDVYNETSTYKDGFKGGGTMRYIGIESKRNPNRYAEVAKRSYRDGSKETDIYLPGTKKERYKRLGRVRINSGREGTLISIDRSKKKRYKKNNSEQLASVVRGGTYNLQSATYDAVNNANKKRKK